MKSNFRCFLSWLGTIIFFFAFVACSFATPADTSKKELTATAFLQIVKLYHPVAKQAQLITERAKAELLIARGGWDPRLYSTYDNKTYNGSNYYSYFENKISIPVWYGIEVNAGYDFAYGQYLNNESVLPSDGLGYLGLSVPLLRNMLIDERRAALRKAQIFREASEQQQLVILNDLFFDALKVYYDWYYAYGEYQIYTEAVKLATIRYNATVQGVVFGDMAAIDTTEALTQLQNRQLQLNEARLRFLNSGLMVSNYLWLENEQPYPVDTTMIPAPLEGDFTQQKIQMGYVDEMATALQQNHPVLLNYAFKMKQLDIERRLKIESLKPNLNLKYNILSEQFNFQSTAGNVLRNNYKFGINFSMPLTFMQGRGALRLTNLEIKNTQYAMDYKRQELLNKMRSTFNELLTTYQQTKLFQQSITGFQALFDGETTRLYNGESSLFMVNARENRLLEAQLRLIGLRAKYYKVEAELKWSVGNMSF